MKRVLSLIFLTTLFSAIRAQDISVTSSPDTSVMMIGDQQRFVVSATLPAGTEALLSPLSDTLVKGIVILGSPVRDTALLNGGLIRITDSYNITGFDSGTYYFPPFFAEVVSDNSMIRFFSDISALRIVRPEITPSDSTDVIFDIVPPRTAPLAFREILPWIIIALVMALIIVVLAKFLPRNPLKIFTRPAPPPEPAHVIAFRELEKLKTEELWQKNEVKEHYSRLSDILRRYINNRYGIMSPELTTDETVRLLQKAGVLQHENLAMIREVLSLSDMVKFAKYMPAQETNITSFDSSRKFVEMTREPDYVPITSGEKKGGTHE